MNDTYTLRPSMNLFAFKNARPNRRGLPVQIECDSGGQPSGLRAEGPSATAQRLMQDLRITFDGKFYRYDRCRYEHYVDAISDARSSNSRVAKRPR